MDIPPATAASGRAAEEEDARRARGGASEHIREAAASGEVAVRAMIMLKEVARVLQEGKLTRDHGLTHTVHQTHHTLDTDTRFV